MCSSNTDIQLLKASMAHLGAENLDSPTRATMLQSVHPQVGAATAAISVSGAAGNYVYNVTDYGSIWERSQQICTYCHRRGLVLYICLHSDYIHEVTDCASICELNQKVPK